MLKMKKNGGSPPYNFMNNVIENLRNQIAALQVELQKEIELQTLALDAQFPFKWQGIVPNWEVVDFPDWVENLPSECDDWNDEGFFHTIWCETEEQLDALIALGLSSC